ncbi:MAG: WecB/TagA/CpsF family glycosyltransferase [Pseudomonadota bacterium]
MNRPLPELAAAAPADAWAFTLPGTAARLTVRRRAALMQEIAGRLSRRQGFALATLNLDHLVKLRHDPAFAKAYAAQDLVTADGNPVVWLAGLAGEKVELIPGADLVDRLAGLAAAEGAPLALIGSTAETLAAAAARLEAAHPGLRIVLTHAPSPSFDPEGQEAAGVIRQLGASGAALAILALGAPKQERFAARARSALPHCGFASLGAGLDFTAGRRARAPRLVRRLALEWLWRLLQEPRRLGARYWGCAALLPRLALAALAARRSRENRG